MAPMAASVTIVTAGHADAANPPSPSQSQTPKPPPWHALLHLSSPPLPQLLPPFWRPWTWEVSFHLVVPSQMLLFYKRRFSFTNACGTKDLLMREYTTTWQLMLVKLQKRTTETLCMQNNLFFMGKLVWCAGNSGMISRQLLVETQGNPSLEITILV